MAKFDADGFRIHKGTIMVNTTNSNGYTVVQIVLSGLSKEYTLAAAQKINERYKDVDYTQFVGTVDTIGLYNSDVLVEFQLYNKQADTYCDPRISFNGRKIPMDLLKVVDKIDADHPDKFVSDLIDKGFTLLKNEYRQITYPDGRTATVRYNVKETHYRRWLPLGA